MPQSRFALIPRSKQTRRAAEKKERRLRSIHSVDWRDSADIVDFVMGMWDTRRQRRWWLERQWYINISYFLGHQWVEWNNTSGSLFQPKAPSYRVRLTANLIQPIARKIAANIISQRPVWTVQPATGDPKDALVARLSEKLVKYYWGGPLKATQKLVDALMWMTTTGLGIERLHWDPRRSSEMLLNSSEFKDESLVNDLKKLESTGDNTINLGDAVLEAKSPFQIDPDPWCTDFSELTWLVDTTMRSTEWVRDQYPKTGKDIEPDDTETLNFFEKRISDLSGPGHHFAGSTGRKSSATQENMVNVHELFVLPFGKFRRGIYAVVAGDTLLDIRKNQFRAGGEVILPYAFMEEIRVPGRLWPTCAIEQAISLQSEYNKGRSQVVENRNLMSRPKWFVPDGANIGDHALTSEPGEVITHTFGHQPIAWTAPPLPPYVLRTLELARQDIQDATLIHDVSLAKAPTGVKSGKAILALQEQDQTVLAPTVICIEEELSKLGAALLELLSRKVKEKRLVKIVGDNELYDVEEFTGSDLLGDNSSTPGVNYFDVRVKMGSQLPLTPDARRQAISELVQVGILVPDRDRDQILELLELGADEPLFDAARMDRANQRKENRLMMKGELMQVEDYDDDLIHIAAMEEFQKTPEYAEKRTPESDAAFSDHKRAHLTNAQAKQSGTFEIPMPDLGGKEGELSAEDLLAEQIALDRIPDGPPPVEEIPLEV